MSERAYGDDDGFGIGTTTNDGGNPINLNGYSGGAKAVDLLESARLARERREVMRRQKMATRGCWVEQQRREYLERCASYALFDLRKHRHCVQRAFGKITRHFRRLLGYTQEELAEIVGLDRTYPSLLERGKRTPTVGIATAISIALNVHPAVWQSSFHEQLRLEMEIHKERAQQRLAQLQQRRAPPPALLPGNSVVN